MAYPINNGCSYTKSISNGYRSCPHPQPFSPRRREPVSKSLACERGLKAFGIPEKGEGISVALIAGFGIKRRGNAIITPPLE